MNAGSVNVKITADTTGFTEAIDEAIGKLKEFRSIKELTGETPAKPVTKNQAGSVNVKLTADTTDFTKAIDEAISKLKELEQLKALILFA